MGNEYLYELERLETELLRPSELAQYDTGMFHITQHAIDDLYCFSDRTDMKEFLDRFARHVSPEPQRDPVRREPYAHHRAAASLVAYCLLENHYHLIIRQFSKHGAVRLMQSVSGSYVKYFNRKYGRERAPVFSAPFSATKINGSVQGEVAMSYVMLNHEVQRENYEFSSFDFYAGRRPAPAWLDTRSGLWFFAGDRDRFERVVLTDGISALERKIARRAASRGAPPRRARGGRASHIDRR